MENIYFNYCSISNAGQLVTVYALGNAIGTPIFMMLTRNMKQKKQLVAALVLLGRVREMCA